MRPERSAPNAMPKKSRVTLAAFFMLLVFVGGSAYLMHRTRAEVPARAAHDPYAGALDPESEDRGGTWRHHAWGEATSRQEPSPALSDGLIPPGPVNDAVYDPQMDAMRRAFGLLGDAAVAELPFEPRTRSARIVDAEGALPVSRDARCELRVLPVELQAYNCLVRVVCDGRVLYPNPEQTAGYVSCELEDGRPVRARDEGHSRADGDPLVDVDLKAGTITVGDHGEGVERYRASLRIEG